MQRTRAHPAGFRGAGIRYAVVAIVFLALGVAAASALNRDSPAPVEASAAGSAATDAAAADDPVGQPVVNETIAAPPGPADTPAAAVAQFLAAEQRGDFDASYQLLTADNRDAVGTSAQWTAAHADLPPVTGWQLDDVQGDDATATVVGTVGFRPTLDEVAGLIPGSASATWRVVAADGRWFVDFDGSDLSPRYPDDAAANAAVRNWVEARQRCDAGLQYDGGLLGRTDLADSLCDVDGEPRVEEARALETQELDALLPSFGSDAGVWARTVDVTAPVALRALVAPLGQDWVVVGVLPPV